MMISLLLVVALLPPAMEQDSREQQQLLQQIRDDLRRQQEQLARLIELLDESRRDQKSTCSVELRLVRGSDQYTVPAGQTAMIPVNLLSTVSQPGAFCLPAEIRVEASYIGVADNLICSGVIEHVAAQGGLTQNVNLQVRPWNTKEFVSWFNEPPGDTGIARRLACVTPDGLNEVDVESLEGVVAGKVQVTAMPRGGGLSSIEIRFNRSGAVGR